MKNALSLGTLKGGAVDESFQEAWKSLVENILDPNTRAEAQREVQIRVICKPNKHRSGADVDVLVITKLAPRPPIETAIFLRLDGDEAYALEPTQDTLFKNEGAN